MSSEFPSAGALPPIKQITREQLYELVWRTPRSILAKSFGMSDVAITKRCKKLQVPTPGLGYWSKLEHGHKPDRPPLPTWIKRGDIEFGSVRFIAAKKVFRIAIDGAAGPFYDISVDRLRSGQDLASVMIDIHREKWHSGQHLKDLLDCIAAWSLRDRLKTMEVLFGPPAPST